MATRNLRSVYSTASGRLCPNCEQALEHCQCTSKTQSSASKGSAVRVWSESKGRRGKTVTLLCNLPLNPSELRNYAKELKRICASGGALKDDTIEIQGDHRKRICEQLEADGYRVKKIGF